MTLPDDARPVPGYPEYWVTPRGEVYRSKVRRLRLNSDGKGYLYVGLYRDGKQQPRGVHRLVALAFLPAPEPEQSEVRHLDGSRDHNTPSNLAWGTTQENAADRARHGRTVRGERMHNAKLTAAQAAEIRASCEPRKDLASRYGVSESTIKAIRCGRLWRFV